MSLSTGALVMRADASRNRGTGHVMRCIALGQAWRDTGKSVIFVTHERDNPLRERLTEERFVVIPVARTHPDPRDWQETSRVLRKHPGSWTVLDGYHFDSNFQQRIREMGHPLLVIDDMAHLPRYEANVVLNQNIHADKLHYPCGAETRILRGPRYALLRSEFLAHRKDQSIHGANAHRILVTLGGSDPDNQTPKVVQAFGHLDQEGLEATVVIGAANTHLEEIRVAARQVPFPVRLVRNTVSMPQLMQWADLAITSGGSTCWELAFMGVPTLVGRIAEVEDLLIAGLSRFDLFRDLGWYSTLSPSEIAEWLKKCLRDTAWRLNATERERGIVDGLGRERVLEVMHELGSRSQS